MRRMWICLAALVLVVSNEPVTAGDEDVRTLAADPVALVNGQDVAGQPDISITRRRYRYLFANEANKAAFERNPGRFEIQLGGGCGRMGPLSGEGRMDLYAAYEGRVYIFASESCRETFLAKGHALLEVDDAKPAASADARQDGAALIAHAVDAHGGAAAIDAIERMALRHVKKVDYSGTEYTVVNAMTFAFPDHVRRDVSWNDDRWSYVLTSDGGYFATDDAFDRSMFPVQQKAMAKAFNRNPLSVLRSRGHTDFVAIDAGVDAIGDHPVQLVDTWFNGTTATLAIAPKSGRIIGMRYRARGLGSEIGDIQTVFSDHREIDGVLVPMTMTTTFNGQPFNDQTFTWTEVELNADVPEGFWVASP